MSAQLLALSFVCGQLATILTLRPSVAYVKGFELVEADVLPTDRFTVAPDGARNGNDGDEGADRTGGADSVAHGSKIGRRANKAQEKILKDRGQPFNGVLAQCCKGAGRAHSKPAEHELDDVVETQE